ncbi:MAG TPA: mannitol dehydrogenase family protein [Gammaproteobacteria bacterium]|nr:mannitol dehydrogenase family protein [Gammaproteobacteria bacterium]
MTLRARTLDRAGRRVALPKIMHPPTGIVHLGAGAFHRAHQAVYTEDAMAIAGGDWGICGVSLRSADVQAALRPQDWLYTLAVLDEQISYRVIGALNSVLVATRELRQVLDAMASPRTHIFTVTVTEKGYCLNLKGELNTGHPDIQRDLREPAAPATVIGIIVEALRRRFAQGVPAPSVISCDNLMNNGRLLESAVLEFARFTDAALARWIEDEVCFPSTMVDSITPATDDALRERVARATGLRDMLPVQREAYTQWVIENRFAGPRPEWEAAGAILTADVAPYEKAKLRLLNAAHSALAYLGSLMGIETVFQAMQNTALAGYVSRMMESEIASAIIALPGLQTGDYTAAILRRFRNPAIQHYLSQIAWDGTQKLPIRALGTLRENLAAGRSVRALCLILAGWMHFVREQVRRGHKLNDPLAERLQSIGAACTLTASHDVAAFLELGEVFAADLAGDARLVQALVEAYRSLGDGSRAAVENALRF